MVARPEVDHDVEARRRKGQRPDVALHELHTEPCGCDAAGGLAQERGLDVQSDQPRGSQQALQDGERYAPAAADLEHRRARPQVERPDQGGHLEPRLQDVPGRDVRKGGVRLRRPQNATPKLTIGSQTALAPPPPTTKGTPRFTQ